MNDSAEKAPGLTTPGALTAVPDEADAPGVVVGDTAGADTPDEVDDAASAADEADDSTADSVLDDIAADSATAVVSDIAASAVDAPTPDAAATPDDSDRANKFHLKLSNFDGPFDLLLQLISSRRLDITEVALHKVTDEFIAYTKALTAQAGTSGLRADKVLDQTTEFLVVAATLLDLKAARLLPSGEVTDEDDLELLDARDLLFARLLQYRAFKHVAELLCELEAAALQRYPRAVSMEDRYLDLLPDVTLGVDAAAFANVAATVFRPRPTPKVGLDHIHQHSISIAEQAAMILELLKTKGPGGWTTFHELIVDCEIPVQIVARFLALLELYRGRNIEFEQPDPLGPLSISWTGDLSAARETGGAIFDTISDEEYG